MIQYTWKFPKFEVNPEIDGHLNVVTAVHWSFIGTSDDNISSEVYGVLDLEYNPEKFVEYDQLTPDLVQTWVVESIGGEESVARFKKNIAAEIESKRLPKTVTVTPAWEMIQFGEAE